MGKQIYTIILTILILGFVSASAQVTISPVALFMDENNRFGTLNIMNGSNEAQEVSIEFQFGYPGTTEDGRTFMNYEDEEAESRYSIAEWVRAFPRTTIIPPNQTQAVRVTVRPPADLEDGTYWTRVKITSVGEAPDIDADPEEGVGAQVQFKFEQVTTAFYKTGATTTTLEINDLEIAADENMITALADLSRSGNSPFLGSMSLAIFDEDDQEVAGQRVVTGFYFDGKRRIEINGHQLPAGTYHAELTLQTDRNDISPSDIISGETATKRITFTID